MSQYSKSMIEAIGPDSSGKWMSTDKVEKLVDAVLAGCIANVEMWEVDSRNHISYMLKNHYRIEE